MMFDPHPALATLPSALLAVVLLLEVARRFTKFPQLASAIRVNLILAAAGAALAFFSGYWAHENAEVYFLLPEPEVAAHHGWGRALLFLVIPCCLLEYLRERAVEGRKFFSALYYILLLGTVAVMVRTSSLGGALVFEHGAGVRGGVPNSPSATNEQVQEINNDQ